MNHCKLVNVFDLGPGDGGKGGVVHKLVQHHNAHTVIKVGGAQGSHGVHHGDKRFAFSQWGCGTFDGVPTYISSRMVISPEGLLNEANALAALGVDRPFEMMTVDRDCVCATPYHGIASRFKELMLGKSPRGTIGTGVGEAFRDSTKFNDCIMSGDLDNYELVRDRMTALRNRLLKQFEDRPALVTEEDEQLYDQDRRLLDDREFLHWNIDRFMECARFLNVDKPFGLYHDVLTREGTAIIECSHGILTDSWVGFKPHVSAIRTLPVYTERMFRAMGYKGEIENVAVHRAYSVRHGAGPLPTADPTLNDVLLPGSCKEENRWQGKIRVGALDFILLKYAIDRVQKDTKIDSIALTWFDQIESLGEWEICEKYQDMPGVFFDDDRIRTDQQTNLYIEGLTEVLSRSVPEITSIDLPNSVEDKLRFVSNAIESRLGIPVSLLSLGASQDDKIMREIANV